MQESRGDIQPAAAYKVAPIYIFTRSTLVLWVVGIVPNQISRVGLTNIRECMLHPDSKSR